MVSLSFKARVPIFDANVRVGDRRDEASPCRNQAQLLAEMDRHGVERALIYHAQTELLSPLDGNGFLESWLGEDGRLVPQWSIGPTSDSLRQIKALHAQGRVRSVRLHDARQVGLPFRRWAYDETLTWLSEANIPLWVLLPAADANDLMTTLQAYPQLVTVLIGAHYSHHLWVRPFLKQLPNAYLELSRYEPIGQFEALRDEFGAERLVYGSWYSRYVMGPILFYLHHTDYTNSELALVCAGNLERILRGAGRHD